MTTAATERSDSHLTPRIISEEMSEFTPKRTTSSFLRCWNRTKYRYDPNGNRVTIHDDDGVVDTEHDVQDRLLRQGASTFVYDLKGTRETKTDASGTTSYTYDPRGNVTTVSLPDATLIEYVVDAHGRRIGRKVNGELVSVYLYVGSHMVAELDATGTAVNRIAWAISAPLYMVRGEDTLRLIADHRGSVRFVVNVDSGEVVQELAYDPYGKVQMDTNPGLQPFGFAGGLYDSETGLVRFGERDYDADTGTWTAKDPTRMNGGFNLYAYVEGDPINFVDPLGLDRDPCSGGDEGDDMGQHLCAGVGLLMAANNTWDSGIELEDRREYCGLVVKQSATQSFSFTGPVEGSKMWKEGDAWFWTCDAGTAADPGGQACQGATGHTVAYYHSHPITWELPTPDDIDAWIAKGIDGYTAGTWPSGSPHPVSYFREEQYGELYSIFGDAAGALSKSLYRGVWTNTMQTLPPPKYDYPGP